MSTIATTRSRYDTLDGLRAYSAIGIILMHVGTDGNTAYKIGGKIFNLIIPALAICLFSV